MVGAHQKPHNSPRPDRTHYGPVVDIAATTVLDLLDRARTAAPERAAIDESGQTVSFSELFMRSERAAISLRDRYGIGHGDTVAVVGEAGASFTAIMLGILRAGAAYLPIDLAYPRSRVGEIIASGQAKLTVLARSSLLADDQAPYELPSGVAVADARQLLCSTSTPERERPWRVINSSDPAYVIFTSGSTGVPKGIVQTHRCLANFVAWQVFGSGLGCQRRILQSAPLSFDVSIQEIFYSLASGGCLFVPDPREKRDPRYLVDFIVRNHIEVVDFPQSLIDTVMSLPRNFRHATALRHIISAGETVRVSPELADLLHDRPQLTLHNHYGPAETHMVASHSMSAALGNIEPSPPVGSVVWNNYVRILDEDGSPVTDGDIGEIYIGGAGVALGYTDTYLTSNRFVPDPYHPATRLHRSRDRGRWIPDGKLSFQGRIDDLIKIRGFRVEPREVESHIICCPGVERVAVFGAARPDAGLELNAVITGRPPSGAELRRRLLGELPDYMVPVRWWLADSLPISPNGKLDRISLPGRDAVPLPMLS